MQRNRPLEQVVSLKMRMCIVRKNASLKPARAPTTIIMRKYSRYLRDTLYSGLSKTDIPWERWSWKVIGEHRADRRSSWRQRTQMVNMSQYPLPFSLSLVTLEKCQRVTPVFFKRSLTSGTLSASVWRFFVRQVVGEHREHQTTSAAKLCQYLDDSAAN